MLKSLKLGTESTESETDMESPSRTNITEFIKSALAENKRILITSDIEGLNPTGQLNKIYEHLKNEDPLIYNGDLLDYTGIGNLSNLTSSNKENLCSLKLLKKLVEGMQIGNVKCQIGNRELNKIKL